jgi:DNA-binding response OmpR family regulator
MPDPAADNVKTVLVAEEDDAARTFLADNLACDGYRTLVADSRAKALAVLLVERPDVIVVDVNGQTLELIDSVRSGAGVAGHIDLATPMVVLTSRAEEVHRIRLLDRGGDDVVGKPFSYPELRARIAALLRRSDQTRERPVLRAGRITIDVHARQTHVAGTPVELSGKEYELLLALAADPTRVFTREELLRSVWGHAYTSSRTLDSHVISSTVSGVGCVGCGFRPGRRRRFISSGVDSALAAELSP